MAEAIFRRVASDRLGCPEEQLPRRGVDVVSAGIAAVENCPASREAVQLLQEQGLDLSGHLSRPVTEELLSASDHIYAMTKSHLAALEEARPDLTGRMELVTRNGRDIPDPIGGGPDVYRRCADALTEAIAAIADDLFRKDDVSP